METGAYIPYHCRGPRFLGLDNSECFVPFWLSESDNGYLYLSVKKKISSGSRNAHWLAALLLLGQLPSGALVLHRCGNGKCCNPHHLYIGYTAQNQRDKILHQSARLKRLESPVCVPLGPDLVYRPAPLPLSQERSEILDFRGFSNEHCIFSDWLHPTVDGYMQVEETDHSGEICGAHRLIYKLFLGSLDKYDIIEHSCKNKRCLNPHHLERIGKQSNPRAFDLKHDKRRTVKEEAFAAMPDKSKTNAEIAREFGNHPGTIGAYRRAILRNTQAV